MCPPTRVSAGGAEFNTGFLRFKRRAQSRTVRSPFHLEPFRHGPGSNPGLTTPQGLWHALRSQVAGGGTRDHYNAAAFSETIDRCPERCVRARTPYGQNAMRVLRSCFGTQVWHCGLRVGRPPQTPLLTDLRPVPCPPETIATTPAPGEAAAIHEDEAVHGRNRRQMDAPY